MRTVLDVDIDSAALLTVDDEYGPADLLYTVTIAPQFGELTLGELAMSAGDTFTQDDVNRGRLTYVHGAEDHSSDSYSFTVADDGENGVQPPAGAFTIVVLVED